MKTVLLTGGNGFIGSHTAVSLIENGYKVVVVDNLVNSVKGIVNKVEKFKDVNIPVYYGDVRDVNLLNTIFKENKIDAVIHFAGLKAVGESVEKPLMYYQNNLDATMNLLEAMLENDVNMLVFSSSATVYAPENPAERTEGMPLGCTNPYGWTKFMGEQIIRDVCFANPKLKAVCLRYFNPVGAHPSGLLGENPKGIPNNLMPYIQQVATGKREYLRVYGDDYDTVDGTGVRDYIHVCDLADAHVAAVGYMDSHNGCTEINIGTGKGTSVLQLVDAFQKANDINIPYQVEGRRAGDVASCYANCQKAKEELGWSAKKNIVDMCKDSFNWQKKLESQE